MIFRSNSHRFAQRQVTDIENLSNLDKVVGKHLTFIGLPLKIRDGTGSPIRAVPILGWKWREKSMP